LLATHPDIAFLPGDFIPVEELIENYGNPNDVWLTSEGSREKPLTHIVLHWDLMGNPLGKKKTTWTGYGNYQP